MREKIPAGVSPPILGSVVGEGIVGKESGPPRPADTRPYTSRGTTARRRTKGRGRPPRRPSAEKYQAATRLNNHRYAAVSLPRPIRELRLLHEAADNVAAHAHHRPPSSSQDPSSRSGRPAECPPSRGSRLTVPSRRSRNAASGELKMLDAEKDILERGMWVLQPSSSAARFSTAPASHIR